jgi:hypothetical protein
MLYNLLLNRSFKEISFHLIILFFISTSAFLKINNYLDFLLIASLLIFIRNNSILSFYYPLALFVWGLYSDLLIGYPFGYTGVIFLFFYLLKEFSNSFGDLENIKPRFYIYILGLLILLFVEYLAIIFFFGATLSIINIFIKYFLMLLLFYPIANIFIYMDTYNEK